MMSSLPSALTRRMRRSLRRATRAKAAARDPQPPHPALASDEAAEATAAQLLREHSSRRSRDAVMQVLPASHAVCALERGGAHEMPWSGYGRAALFVGWDEAKGANHRRLRGRPGASCRLFGVSLKQALIVDGRGCAILDEEHLLERDPRSEAVLQALAARNVAIVWIDGKRGRVAVVFAQAIGSAIEIDLDVTYVLAADGRWIPQVFGPERQTARPAQGRAVASEEPMPRGLDDLARVVAPHVALALVCAVLVPKLTDFTVSLAQVALPIWEVMAGLVVLSGAFRGLRCLSRARRARARSRRRDAALEEQPTGDGDLIDLMLEDLATRAGNEHEARSAKRASEHDSEEEDDEAERYEPVP
jgi:hypothetical protein